MAEDQRDLNQEPQHRRWWFWVLAGVLFGFAVLPAIWAIFGKGSLIRLLWILPAGLALTLLRWLARYSKGSPNCPHCREDITSCNATHCYVCGEKLDHGRCSRCGLDTTWTAGFETAGLVRQPIVFCPGCGVRLNSAFYRFEDMGD